MKSICNFCVELRFNRNSAILKKRNLFNVAEKTTEIVVQKKKMERIFYYGK